VRLVERTTRSVAPTAAGQRLLERLCPVLEEYESALESTNEFRGKPAGILRLTAPLPVGDFFLASALLRFLAQYPEIPLDLSFNDALTDIVGERFDAGIRLGEQIERDMIAVRVTDELADCRRRLASLLRATRQTQIAEGPRRARLHLYPIFERYLLAFRVKRRDLEVHVGGRLVVNLVTIARRAAVEDLGLIQMPPLFIAKDLAEGGLVTVLDQWAPADLSRTSDFARLT